jgi:hypothetical protein
MKDEDWSSDADMAISPGYLSVSELWENGGRASILLFCCCSSYHRFTTNVQQERNENEWNLLPAQLLQLRREARHNSNCYAR